VYGTARFVPITEEHPLQGQSPYSASKIGADQLAYSFYSSFDLPVVIARPFNTYGPRQSARAVIPTVITQIANGTEQLKLGLITPTRDFSFVQDTVDAFVATLRSDVGLGEVVNFGSNFEISIADVVRLIAEKMNATIDVISDSERIRPVNSEVERLWADNSKVRDLFGWSPIYAGRDGLARGLQETINWFTQPENLQYYKSDIYNL
jgi:dTDP-glucose 4,6-dehydratase